MDAQYLTLKDGRRLAYAEHGDPDGKPVFFFHGMPGSRLFRHPDESIAHSLAARIITADRPGFGQSDPQPGRTLLDWADDVAALADSLKIKRFAVGGISGGGPFALACAYRLPDRVTRAGLASGSAPYDIPESVQGVSAFERSTYDWMRQSPRAAQITAHVQASQIWAIAKIAPQLQATISRLASPPADRAALSLPGVAEVLTADFAEAYRNGIQGQISDALPLINSWGFSLSQIKPPVHFWLGDRDIRIPRSMGDYMARVIPNCTPHYCPGEGHLLFFNHWQEILTVLVS